MLELLLSKVPCINISVNCVCVWGGCDEKVWHFHLDLAHVALLHPLSLSEDV